MELEPRIYELHITPTYAVYIPQRQNRGRPPSAQRIKNEINLQDNKQKGIMSYKASKRLKNAVNWLVASAPEKHIYDKKTGSRYAFKVNFITLTLPSEQGKMTDHFFKKVLLHNFVNTCRYRFGLSNYIWKVETQKNGNIHAHFTTDTFIHYDELRSVWNRILDKNGLIDSYHEKHKDLSFAQYLTMYSRRRDHSVHEIRKSYDRGVKSRWRDPNSTDVHAVWKVNDLAAYLATYMSKKEVGRRLIKGRLWACSQSLSESNKLVLELHGHADNDLLDSLMHPEIDWKPITVQSKLTQQFHNIGEMFFFNLLDWGYRINGRILDAFNEHRFNIRHNIQKVKESLDQSLGHTRLAPIVVDLGDPPDYGEQLRNQFNFN